MFVILAFILITVTWLSKQSCEAHLQGAKQLSAVESPAQGGLPNVWGSFLILSASPSRAVVSTPLMSSFAYPNNLSSYPNLCPALPILTTGWELRKFKRDSIAQIQYKYND